MLRHLLAVAAGAALIAGPLPAQAEWQPDRPITVIVPWGAGGSTDQIVRLLATQLEDELGTTLVIVNQPGASGSIGTRSVLEAPRDGYTWASGAAKDVGTDLIQAGDIRRSEAIYEDLSHRRAFASHHSQFT